MAIAEVTAEKERAVRRAQFDAGGAEDVPGVVKDARQTAAKRGGRPVPVNRAEQLDASQDVVHVVERWYACFPSPASFAGLVRCVFHLEVGRVREHEPRDLGGRPRAEDAAGEALADEPRQEAGVVEMRVRQQDEVDRFRVEWERGAIRPILIVHALEEAAVEKKPHAVCLNQVAGAGDGALPRRRT